MWLCNQAYDNVSGLMENASCLSSPGSSPDPQPGQNTPSYANCQGGAATGTCSSTSGCTAVSAGFQAEDTFGRGAYAIPEYSTSIEYGYGLCQPSGTGCCQSGGGCSPNSWARVINSGGTFNYFNWLNAWNNAPAVPGTIRQGLSGLTHSLNPYIAETPQDIAILTSVYDSFFVADPYNAEQYINWMSTSTSVPTSLTYSPPPGTTTTYRFTLPSYLTFQDGNPVTAFDVAFSYTSLLSTGSVLAATLSSMTGITILSARIFDINLNSRGVFVLPSITAVPILPGRYWVNDQLTWKNDITNCGNNSSCYPQQYTVSGTIVSCTPTSNCNKFSDSSGISLMQVDPAKTNPTFDPVQQRNFVGSGPWQCGAVTTDSTGRTHSGTCTPDGTMSPSSGGYTLTANVGYFRSSQNLAKYIWSGESDTNAIGPASSVSSCFNQPVNLSGPCGHWQQGIGNPGSGTPVAITTVQIVNTFFDLNWLFPFEWAINPPDNVASLPPLLYGLALFDGSTVYAPNPGGTSCTTPNTYYDC